MFCVRFVFPTKASRQVDHISLSSACMASVLEPLEFVSGECSSTKILSLTLIDNLLMNMIIFACNV